MAGSNPLKPYDPLHVRSFSQSGGTAGAPLPPHEAFGQLASKLQQRKAMFAKQTNRKG